MVITYHGGECFKVSSGSTTLVCNPVAKGSQFPPVKFGADVAFLSLNHPDFNGIEQVTYGEKVPFAVTGPGEYEIGDITARGWGVQTTYDSQERFNTIYQISLEGINLLFLGALGSGVIDAKVLGDLADADILFVPVGGGDVLDAAAASALAVKLEPHLIIPMHYDKTALEAFLKEAGADSVKPEEKLTVKKKDLLEKEGDILILKE